MIYYMEIDGADEQIYTISCVQFSDCHRATCLSNEARFDSTRLILYYYTVLRRARLRRGTHIQVYNGISAVVHLENDDCVDLTF